MTLTFEPKTVWLPGYLKVIPWTHCDHSFLSYVEDKPVASEAICKWGGAQSEIFLMFPHFSLVPPHEGAQRLFVTDWETTELSPSVGYAVCTSILGYGWSRERGNESRPLMGPSAVPCRLLGYYKLTTLCGSRLHSYNACPTVQYSIGIGL